MDGVEDLIAAEDALVASKQVLANVVLKLLNSGQSIDQIVTMMLAANTRKSRAELTELVEDIIDAELYS